jgi:peptidoglycan-N-acetylglucosamine deacetylase
MGTFEYIILLVVLYHIYFLPDYMLELLLKDKSIVYKNPNLIVETSSFLLTFDDSPTPYTNDILDVLNTYNLKAVFFVLSDHIEGSEAVLDRIVREGHMLGNHGTMDRVHAFMDAETFKSDFLECHRKLHPWTKTQHRKVFRPGFGFFRDHMFPILEEYDYTMVLGNVYCHDYVIASPSINAWYIQQKLNHDSIVVMHDNQVASQTLLNVLQNSDLRSS